MDILERLNMAAQENKESIITEVIKDLIEEHASKRERYKMLYKRYTGKEAPIHSRKLTVEKAINNKLHNDFEGEIVDQLNGLLFGNPIAYQVDEQKRTDAEIEKNKQLIDDFALINDIADLDAETGKISSVCSTASRLLYIDGKAQERVMLVYPWETIFIYDKSLDEIQYAMRYYEVKDGSKDRWLVEWYDDKYMTEYIESDQGYIIHAEPIEHLFDYVPLVEFENNSERLSDFEKVAEIIDAYDRTISDAQNEIEEFRQAYMKFAGVEPDEETMEMAKLTGAFGLPEGGDVGFITKQINDVFLENHKKTLKDNIYRFSKSVDYSDEKFSGSSESGESRKWKLLSLENRAIIKERKFTKSLRQMFKVLCSSWNRREYNLDYTDIYWQFKRNLPVELLHLAEIQSKLKGLVSDKTRLGYIVDDVPWEQKQMLIEQQEMAESLYSIDVVDDVEGDDE